jgi:predicted nucleotidyltransferase
MVVRKLRVTPALVRSHWDALPRMGASVLRRLMLRTQAGPLRPLWRLAYADLTRAVAAFVTGSRRASAVYFARGLGLGDPVYGLSDLDISVIVPGAPGRPGRERMRAERRWRRLRRLIPPLDDLFDLSVYEPADLEGGTCEPAFTYGLNDSQVPRETPGAGVGRSARALYDRARLPQQVARHERPTLYRPMADWRLLSGPDLRPAASPFDSDRRRLVAWLDLQFWWGHASMACVEPAATRAYLCVKLIAEPARLWLWLTEGTQVFGRRRALELALRRMPGEEDSFRWALDLHRGLARAPAPLGEALPHFVRLSRHVAKRIGAEVADAGTTPVRLRWRGRDGVVTPEARAVLAQRGRMRDLVPLTDWRALVWPWTFDEALLHLVGEPARPEHVAAAAACTTHGLQTALRSGSLLVLPAARWSTGQGRLRSVQCPVSDPVSFAVLDGCERAAFPNVPGWSARDTARRAVAEHRAKLWESPSASAPAPLGRTLAAARAALFLDSVEANEPELPLTLSATAALLSERDPRAGPVAEAAIEGVQRSRLEGMAPDPRTEAALHALVCALPAYAKTPRRSAG